jgi:hypothetical protein
MSTPRPFFVWRRIDPDEATLLAVLDEAFARALEEAQRSSETPVPVPADQPGPQALRQRAEVQPEGAHYWCWLGSDPDLEMVIGLAWWTDVLGRCHWRVEAGYAWGGSTFLDRNGPDKHYISCLPSPAPSPFDRTAEYPPVSLIYPEQASCWRHRDGRRQWLMLCTCCACGTVDQLAWTGERCGPCHDKLLDEGNTAVEPAWPRASSVAFDSAGRLIAAVLGDMAIELVGWSLPWRWDAPTWRTRFGQRPEQFLGHMALAVHGQSLAVGGLGRLAVLDTGDGHILASHEGRHLSGCDSLVFAGQQMQFLARLHPGGLWVMHREEIAASVEWKCGLLNRLNPCMAATPDGGLLLAGWTSNRLDWHDAARGTLLHRLQVPGADRVTALAVSTEGEVFALGTRSDQTSWLARWQPISAPPPAGVVRHFASFIKQSTALPADDVTTVPEPGERLVLSPAGTLVAYSTVNDVVIHSRQSLAEEVRLQFPAFVRDLAFSPDGETLAIVADESLTLWPVRRLLGD